MSSLGEKDNDKTWMANLEVLEFHNVAPCCGGCLTHILKGMSALRTLRVPEAGRITKELVSVVAKLTTLQDLDFSRVSHLLVHSPT